LTIVQIMSAHKYYLVKIIYNLNNIYDIFCCFCKALPKAEPTHTVLKSVETEDMRPSSYAVIDGTVDDGTYSYATSTLEM